MENVCQIIKKQQIHVSRKKHILHLPEESGKSNIKALHNLSEM